MLDSEDYIENVYAGYLKILYTPKSKLTFVCLLSGDKDKFPFVLKVT